MEKVSMTLRSEKKRLMKNLCKLLIRDVSEMVELPLSIKIQSPSFTLESCQKIMLAHIRGAYLRFGDGEINQLQGRSDLMQSASPQISKEMREAFNLGGEGILKGLPLHSPRFGMWPGMAPGIHGQSDEWAEKMLRRSYQFFIGTPIFSPVALPYLAVFNPTKAREFLIFLKQQNPLFIGNRNASPEIIERLFGCQHWVHTPDCNSFSEIDRIESESCELIASGMNRYQVAVVAMGSSGKILAKRLLVRGYNIFVFDFGSLLDAFCGWKTRAWMELAPYDVRNLLDQL